MASEGDATGQIQYLVCRSFPSLESESAIEGKLDKYESLMED